MSKVRIAIIDDDIEWINIISNKLLEEFPMIYIDRYTDFINFYKSTTNEDIIYDVIFLDFFYNGYSLEPENIRDIIPKIKHKKILLTGYPKSVSNHSEYDFIINKTHISKEIFRFSRYIDLNNF